jgi:hypothetical protein
MAIGPGGVQVMILTPALLCPSTSARFLRHSLLRMLAALKSSLGDCFFVCGCHCARAIPTIGMSPSRVAGRNALAAPKPPATRVVLPRKQTPPRRLPSRGFFSKKYSG